MMVVQFPYKRFGYYVGWPVTRFVDQKLDLWSTNYFSDPVSLFEVC